MTNHLLALALLCIAGCSTNGNAQYQVGDSSSPKLGRAAAERAHAAIPRSAPAGYDSSPEIISSVFPECPPGWQFTSREEATVVTQFTVAADGSVKNPVVLGSPAPELAELVVHALTQWRFKPALKNGQPAPIRIQQEFAFKVE